MKKQQRRLMTVVGLPVAAAAEAECQATGESMAGLLRRALLRLLAESGQWERPVPFMQDGDRIAPRYQGAGGRLTDEGVSRMTRHDGTGPLRSVCVAAPSRHWDTSLTASVYVAYPDGLAGCGYMAGPDSGAPDYAITGPDDLAEWSAMMSKDGRPWWVAHPEWLEGHHKMRAQQRQQGEE